MGRMMLRLKKAEEAWDAAWQDFPREPGWYWFEAQSGGFDLWEVRRTGLWLQARCAGCETWFSVGQLEGQWRGPVERLARGGRRQRTRS